MKITLDIVKSICMIYGIKIIYAGLPDGLLGRANAKTLTIVLNDSLRDNPQEEKCVLLEEIGHSIFPPRPGHIRFHSKNFYKREDCGMIKQTVAQDERKARDWATSVLLGNVDIARIKEVGAFSLNELADYYDVAPWFMEHRVGYLRRKAHENGQKLRWREIINREQSSWTPDVKGF